VTTTRLRAPRLLLATGSVVALLVVLLLAEFVVRLVAPQILFAGTDRRLMRENAFGSTYGWVPDATGICMGKTVSIGPDGFRNLPPHTGHASLLLLGDSVTFGPGLEADSTFAGMLQHSRPDIHIMNSAVIGYSLEHYRDVLASLVPRDSTIRQVILCYSLNDYEPTIALGPEPQSFLWHIASFLREHSTLYLFLKNLFFDRSETYFLHDYAHYRSPGVAATLNLLDSVVTRAQSGGIPCTVLLLPCEYQLRKRDKRYLLPQQVVTAFCRTRNVAVIDAYHAFTDDGGPSTAYFLYGDHMHLSGRGHRVVFRLLSPEVRL